MCHFNRSTNSPQSAFEDVKQHDVLLRETRKDAETQFVHKPSAVRALLATAQLDFPRVALILTPYSSKQFSACPMDCQSPTLDIVRVPLAAGHVEVC